MGSDETYEHSHQDKSSGFPEMRKRTEEETNKRVIEVSFSNLSQSTQSEIPRNAIISATIPKGTDNAVMLVA